jgi:hypothetical protein
MMIALQERNLVYFPLMIDYVNKTEIPPDRLLYKLLDTLKAVRH